MSIQFQIVERAGCNLKRTLTAAMRTGSLETLIAERRGKKIRHISKAYPGWMTWSYDKGVITCRVLSPRQPGAEWKLFHAFLGRLADRFADQIHSINIQFFEDEAAKPRRTTKRRTG
jgi:hypothetical protein